jgi:hypothetical protein
MIKVNVLFINCVIFINQNLSPPNEPVASMRGIIVTKVVWATKHKNEIQI